MAIAGVGLVVVAVCIVLIATRHDASPSRLRAGSTMSNPSTSTPKQPSTRSSEAAGTTADGETTSPPPSVEAAHSGKSGPREVTSTVVQITDDTRPVVREGTTISSVRNLPTTVWAPTGTDRLPLVVFAHGYRLGPNDYARFCSTLASAGFIVAAPSFPLADESRGNGLDRDDIPNEATDVSRVLDAMVDGSFANRIVTGAYAVVGHSDGADVTLLDGYGQGKVDARLRAVVAIAPDAMTTGVAASVVPLLLVQGDADSIVPYSEGETVYSQIGAPRGFLTLTGADHLPPIAGGTKWTPVLDESVATFLAHALAGPVSASRSSQALDAVRDGLDESSPATFR